MAWRKITEAGTQTICLDATPSRLSDVYVPWLVCVCSVCYHHHELCKNGWTDRDAIWDLDLSGSKESCIRWYPDSPVEGSTVHLTSIVGHWILAYWTKMAVSVAHFLGPNWGDIPCCEQWVAQLWPWYIGWNDVMESVVMIRYVGITRYNASI